MFLDGLRERTAKPVIPAFVLRSDRAVRHGFHSRKESSPSSSSSLCLLASTDHAPAGCPAPRFTWGPREPRRQGTGSRGHSPSHTLAHKGGFKRKHLKLQGLPTHRCRSRTHLPATQNLATLGHPFPARFLAPRHLPAHLPKPLRQPFNCSPALELPATLSGEKPKGKQRDKAQLAQAPGVRTAVSLGPGSAQPHSTCPSGSPIPSPVRRPAGSSASGGHSDPQPSFRHEAASELCLPPPRSGFAHDSWFVDKTPPRPGVEQATEQAARGCRGLAPHGQQERALPLSSLTSTTSLSLLS